MTRTVAMLLALTVAACGSASPAGPKTSNPPIKTDPPKTPDPAAKPPVEEDGLLIKFNIFGFSLTLPNDQWAGNVQKGQDGNLYVSFGRNDANLMVLMLPIGIPGADAKSLAERQQKLFSGDATNTVGPVEQEAGGRWRFTLESKADDGTLSKGRMSAQPIPGGKPDRYLLAMVMAPAVEYDKLIGEAMSLLDSLKPLP